MTKFIGRKQELKDLNALTKLKKSCMVVLNGRRRIGKSRLINEFAGKDKFYEFSGLPPEKSITAQAQRDEFARQCSQYFGLPGLKADDWGSLFDLLAQQTQQGRIIILLDEISWMAHGDDLFLGKLKTSWDRYFSKNPKLMLFLCGSVSSWIEENILASTGYLGRPTLAIRLKELPLADCAKFWGAHADHISDYEKFKLLAVTGGVPRYLELISPDKTAEDNIQFWCFNPNGPLSDEFEKIFSDVYGKRSNLYQRVVERLAKGSATQEEISQDTAISQSGDLSHYLNDLELGGFISRDYTWNLKKGKISKLSHYRLIDNYSRFYLRCILPHKEAIEKGDFIGRSLKSIPGWDSILGLQFENLVINNRRAIYKAIDIKLDDIIFANPYFQRKTQRQKGCQIDYLIQTRLDCLYICEIKFQRKPIGMDILNEMKEKISALGAPKYYSRRAILIHVNGVTSDVIDSGYFAKIIHFSELLS